jgi:hypothetical protein
MKSLPVIKALSLGFLVCVLFLAGALAGCSKKIPVQTQDLDYAFQAADSSTQTTVNEAIESIEKADYSSASAKLKKVAADPKLTPEQKTAVAGVLDQIEKH